jgi:superfamily II DNA or RNA helicase
VFNLRYYQNELIAGARKAWESVQSTAIISATATGKTVIFSHLAADWPGRVLVMAHHEELMLGDLQPLLRLLGLPPLPEALERASP